MSDPLDDMMKATRLTQAGRLNEATALLQRMLGAAAPARSSSPEGRAAKSGVEPPAINGVAQRQTSLNVGETASSSPHLNGSATATPSGPLSGVFQRLQGLGLRKPLPPASEIVPGVGRFVSKSFSNEAGSRAYKLYIPSSRGKGPRPLIVMLHGCTQSPDDFAAGTRMNFVAEEHACFVVYPEQSSAANASKCWNWFKTGDQKRGQGEPDIIAGITRQVMAEHKIDPKRIYIAGLSAGGAAAAVAGEAYPDLYAAVGVHSGLACGVARDMPSAFAAMQGRHPVPDHKDSAQAGFSHRMPTIVFHGDRDSTVHPRNGGEVIDRARAGGEFQTVVENGNAAAGHSYTRSILRDAKGRGLLEQWVIHGAGHAWSGGSPSGSFTDQKGPDATKEMVRFFLEHTHAPLSAKAK
jgi:poly(hydroxyalkanoate) depolymerase family esterase